jgi:hypothetical protein
LAREDPRVHLVSLVHRVLWDLLVILAAVD